MNSQGSTAIQAFVFPETNQKIRVFVDPDGTLWFVATDVCRMLGYKGNVSRIIQLHCKSKGVTKRNTLTNGGMQEVTVIDERNLYRLMGKSEAPNADPFQDWFYGEVLPSIRKTGSYGHKPQLEFDPNDLDHVRSVLAALSVQTIQYKATIEALKVETAKVTTRVVAAKAKLAAQTPVVHAYKRLAASEGSMNITEAAKNLRMPPRKLTNYMLDAHWLYMRPPATRKIAYQSKIKQGWMSCHENTKPLPNGRELVFIQYKVSGLEQIFMEKSFRSKIQD
jgi:anti-repressor protein